MSARIVVIHVAAIGDAAVASTVAERLRAEEPAAHVTWVCGEAVAPIVRLFDGVKQVITVDQRALFRGGPLSRARTIASLWAKLVGRFDRAIVLHPDPRYRVLLLPLIATRKSFLSRARHGEMNPVPERFLGDEYARLVGGTEHLGPIEGHWPMADLRGRFAAPQARPRKRVLLVPGGARNHLRDNPLRRWPLAHWVTLAETLLRNGHDVALIGGPDDDWVRPAFADVAVDDRMGKLTLVETLELIHNSDLVISHDTGPMHLARLVRAPLVALFGPTSPNVFLSRDESVTVVWGGADLACRPCYDGREFARCSENICLSRVTPRAVVDAAAGVLGPIA